MIFSEKGRWGEMHPFYTCSERKYSEGAVQWTGGSPLSQEVREGVIQSPCLMEGAPFKLQPTIRQQKAVATK